MLTTTLVSIRAHDPCKSSWKKLIHSLGGIKKYGVKTPLPYADILRICGLDDALWAFCAEPKHKREWRLYAVACARRVQHLMTDPRGLTALDVAERYANGQATLKELHAAGRAAWDAALKARLYYAAYVVTEYFALYAAYAAARASADAFACSSTCGSTENTAWNSAWSAERAWQEQEFLRVVGGNA